MFLFAFKGGQVAYADAFIDLNYSTFVEGTAGIPAWDNSPVFTIENLTYGPNTIPPGLIDINNYGLVIVRMEYTITSGDLLNYDAVKLQIIRRDNNSSGTISNGQISTVNITSPGPVTLNNYYDPSQRVPTQWIEMRLIAINNEIVE